MCRRFTTLQHSIPRQKGRTNGLARICLMAFRSRQQNPFLFTPDAADAAGPWWLLLGILFIGKMK